MVDRRILTAGFGLKSHSKYENGIFWRKALNFFIASIQAENDTERIGKQKEEIKSTVGMKLEMMAQIIEQIEYSKQSADTHCEK